MGSGQLVRKLYYTNQSKSKFRTVSSHQTNNWVDIKTQREALLHVTEAVSILTIHSVNVTDTGPYICNVTSIDTTLTQQTQVIVYGKLRTVHVYYFLMFNRVCKLKYLIHEYLYIIRRLRHNDVS